jgi:hypothetical protein
VDMAGKAIDFNRSPAQSALNSGTSL